ncbi:MAG: hypothetical protein RIK87_27415 [Fuerstiella sp.]
MLRNNPDDREHIADIIDESEPLYSVQVVFRSAEDRGEQNAGS